MSQIYSDRKRTAATAPQKENVTPQPAMDALRSGAVQPTAEQMGHRVDLPDAMRAKMENAFGADLGAVKLYESQAVADTGAKAITQGSNIAFAPGMLDFSSYGGQALLGHELSHVVSQARGEVTGGGFLNDSMLEARADREGAMAAAGESVAVPTAAMSPVSASAAAGPMQAKGKDKSPEAQIEKIRQKTDKQQYANKSARDKAYYGNLGSWIESIPKKKLEKDPALREAILQETVKGSRGQVESYRAGKPGSNSSVSYEEFNTEGLRSGVGDTAMGAFTKLVSRFTGDEKTFAKDMDGDADASIRRYHERVAGSDTAMDLLSRFSDSFFAGTDYTEEQRSHGLMNSLYNHQAAVLAPQAAKTGDKTKLLQANAARRLVGIDREGGYNANTTATGKEFLNLLVGRGNAPAAQSQPDEIDRVAQDTEAFDADLEPGRKRSGTIFSTL